MRKLLLLCLLCTLALPSWADSPLTSTTFCRAYMDVPEVAAARQSNGVITESLMAYLLDEDNPADVKMAVVNAIGWNFDGSDNGLRFAEYVVAHTEHTHLDHWLNAADPATALALAYLMALDDYFDVNEAAILAEQVVPEDTPYYSLRVVKALILAQDAVMTDWCEVHRQAQHAEDHPNLIMDLRPEGKKVITDYMAYYEDEC